MKPNSTKTYCRACMQVNFEGAVNLSCTELDEDGKTLLVYFNECTQLRAELSDELPQIICANCAEQLKYAYNFIKKAQQTDRELKKICMKKKVRKTFYWSKNERQEYSAETQNDPLAAPDLQKDLNEMLTMKCDSDLDIPMSDIKLDRKDKDHEKEDKDDGIHDHHEKNLSYGKNNSKSSEKLDREENEVIVDDDSDYLMPSDEEENGSENSKNYRAIQTGCSLCDYKYSTQDKLKDHIYQMHKSHIICLECPKVYEFPNELHMHEYLVHDTESPKQCNWCKKAFKPEDLPNHFHNRHRDAYAKYFPRIRLRDKNGSDISSISCECCQKSFPSVLELADHMKDCKFHCPMCLKSFKKLGTYRAHLRRIHNRTLTSLKSRSDGRRKVKLRYKQERTMSEHNHVLYIDDGGVEVYACPHCEKRFKYRTSLYNHKSQKHRDMIITESDNTISEDEEREGSKTKHSDESNRKFLCSFCSREFRSELSVKSHEKKIHLGERPELEPCPICKKKFDPVYLKKHMQCVHTSERKFSCDVCGVSFKSYLLMYSHKLLHLERNFPCMICEKKFVRSYDLKVHMRTHTGEQPYACHICDKRFKIKVRLTYHLKRHAGHKWKCEECGKEFNQIAQLKIHSYKHTGMPYRCTLCHYVCGQRDHFRKHLRRMHDMTMTDEEYSDMFRVNTGRSSHVKTLEELHSEEQSFEPELQSEGNEQDESN